MEDLWTALGLVMVIEGSLYALFPQQMIRVAGQLSRAQPAALRAAGLLSVALGWLCVKLVRGA
ncbi:MAG: DUF2065 domain-containing protein [Zetaproteobacteria bacterium]|nr:MAG: DUF2065 domain-containing protein [Zetaproteobacteria bacterium]